MFAFARRGQSGHEALEGEKGTAIRVRFQRSVISEKARKKNNRALVVGGSADSQHAPPRITVYRG